MSIGGSLLNLELSRPHDTFMQQIASAWEFFKGHTELQDQEQAEKNSPELTMVNNCVTDAD